MVNVKDSLQGGPVLLFRCLRLLNILLLTSALEVVTILLLEFMPPSVCCEALREIAKLISLYITSEVVILDELSLDWLSYRK